MKNYKLMWTKLKRYFEASNQTMWGINNIKFLVKEIEAGRMKYLERK